MMIRRFSGQIVGTCLGLSLFGCGLKQDPLAGRDGRLRDGVPTRNKVKFDTPVPSEAIIPHAPLAVLFDEGRAGEFLVSARVVLPEYVTSIEIDNLPDFPGAAFDKEAGKITWTPPDGFVDAGGGSRGEISRPLTFTVTAMRPEHQVLYRKREVALTVRRSAKEPTIRQVDAGADSVREGEVLPVRIKVRDMDALPSDSSTWPELVFQSVGTQKSLDPWIRVISVRASGTADYDFECQADLRAASVTATVEKFRTAVTALAKSGRKSAAENFDLTVFTRLSPPITNWAPSEKFKVGERKVIQFLVYDPSGKGAVSLDRPPRDVPANATLDCRNLPPTVAIMTCSLDWTPAPEQSGKKSFVYLSAVSKNVRADLDPTVAKADIFLGWQVDPADPMPGPQPPPVPQPPSGGE